MACCRRWACAFAMVDSSLGAYCHTCQIALCSRCHGTVLSVGEALQATSVVRTVHGSLSCRRVAAACRSAWAWSAPAGNGGRATGVGRPATGGGAPVLPWLPIWPNGLTPRGPCGCGPSPGVAIYVRWQSACCTLGPNRLTRIREVAGRFPRPSPAVADHASHADAAPAPPSPRCSARCASAGRSLRD
jgi:hypothetical protein